MSRAPGQRASVVPYALFVALSLGPVAVAGCASSDADPADTAISSGSVSTSDGTLAPDETASRDSAAQTDGAAEAGGTGEFCASARAFEDADPTGDIFAVDDPAVIEQRWDEFDALLSDLVDTAPTEIAPDFEKVAATFGLLRKAYEQAGWDPVAVFDVVEADPELRAVFEGSDPEAEAAGERISAYLDEVCGPPTS